jgi:hypothetical protein
MPKNAEGPNRWLRCLAVFAVTTGPGCSIDGRNVTPVEGAGDTTVESSRPSGSGEGGSPDRGITDEDGAAAGGNGTGATDLPLVEGEAPSALGAACQRGGDCASVLCVDGVCCDSPCTESCAACNLPGSMGTCSAAPSDPLCPAATCQEQSSECLTFEVIEASACEALGVCRVNAECAAVPAPEGTPCEQRAGACDGEGACRVPEQSELGGDCDGDADCRVGACASNGVCCAASCDPVCEACSPDGACQSNGACDAFDCIAPSPPEVFANLPVDAVFLLSVATPPAGRGGTVRDGRYTPIRIDLYGEEQSTVFVATYEFRGRSVQVAYQPFTSLSPPAGVIPELQFAGTYETADTSLELDLERCDPQFELDLPLQQYTATANGLVTIVQQGPVTVVTSYALQ